MVKEKKKTMNCTYLLGVVVRVANVSLHPDWFLMENGTKGDRFLPVVLFIGKKTKMQS